MVGLNSLSNSQCHSSSSTPSPRGASIIAKLRQNHAKHQNESTGVPFNKDSDSSDLRQEFTTNKISSSKKSFLEKQAQASRNYASDSSDSSECKTVLQKRLKNRKSKQSQKKIDSSSDESDCSLDSESSKSKDTINVNNEIGLLHLKKPLINIHNEAKYYESRGRMDPINWSEMENSDKDDPKPNGINKRNNNTIELESQLQKVSENKPAATIDSKEFINFVENTTDQHANFTVGGNLISNTPCIETPLLKIKRMLTNNNQSVCYMTQDVKELFRSSPKVSNKRAEQYVKELIKSRLNKSMRRDILESDKLKNKSVDLTKPDNKINGTENIKTNGKINKIKKFSKMDMPENFCTFDSKDTLSTVGDISRPKAVKKSVKDYTDDMFNFENPVSNNKVPSMSFSSDNSIINNSESSFLTDKSLNCTNSSYIESSNSPKSSVSCNSYNRSLYTTRNLSFDSDDLSTKNTSLNCSTDSKNSIAKRFETMKNSLIDAAESKHSMKLCTPPKQNAKEIKTCKGELLLKETSTKYFTQNHSNEVENVTSDKIENIKITSTDELLLKPVSTRYFTNSIKQTQDLNPEQRVKNDKAQETSYKNNNTSATLSQLHNKRLLEKVNNRIFLLDECNTTSNSSCDDIFSIEDDLSEPSHFKSSVIIEEINSDSEIKTTKSKESVSIVEETNNKTLTPNSLHLHNKFNYNIQTEQSNSIQEKINKISTPNSYDSQTELESTEDTKELIPAKEERNNEKSTTNTLDTQCELICDKQPEESNSIEMNINDEKFTPDSWDSKDENRDVNKESEELMPHQEKMDNGTSMANSWDSKDENRDVNKEPKELILYQEKKDNGTSTPNSWDSIDENRDDNKESKELMPYQEKIDDRTSTPNSWDSQHQYKNNSFDFEDEFDIVNIEELGPYKELVASFTSVQKAFAKNINPAYECDTDYAKTSLTTSNLKSIENNPCLSTSATTSNLDSDSDKSSNSIDLLTNKNNVFEDLNLDKTVWEKGVRDYKSPPSKDNSNSVIKVSVESKRKKKLINALENYKKNITDVKSKEIPSSSETDSSNSVGIETFSKRLYSQ